DIPGYRRRSARAYDCSRGGSGSFWALIDMPPRTGGHLRAIVSLTDRAQFTDQSAPSSRSVRGSSPRARAYRRIPRGDGHNQYGTRYGHNINSGRAGPAETLFAITRLAVAFDVVTQRH